MDYSGGRNIARPLSISPINDLIFTSSIVFIVPKFPVAKSKQSKSSKMTKVHTGKGHKIKGHHHNKQVGKGHPSRAQSGNGQKEKIASQEKSGTKNLEETPRKKGKFRVQLSKSFSEILVISSDDEAEDLQGKGSQPKAHLKHGRDKHSKAKGCRNSSNVVRDDITDFIDGVLGTDLACAKLVSPGRRC